MCLLSGNRTKILLKYRPMENFWPSHVKTQRLLLQPLECLQQPLHERLFYWLSVHLIAYTYSDFDEGIKRPRPSKFIGPDHIPASIINGCSYILFPVLKYILSLSLCFPYPLEVSCFVPLIKKERLPYRTITHLSPFQIPLHNYLKLSYMSRFTQFYLLSVTNAHWLAHCTLHIAHYVAGPHRRSHVFENNNTYVFINLL